MKMLYDAALHAFMYNKNNIITSSSVTNKHVSNKSNTATTGNTTNSSYTHTMKILHLNSSLTNYNFQIKLYASLVSLLN